MRGEGIRKGELLPGGKGLGEWARREEMGLGERREEMGLGERRR